MVPATRSTTTSASSSSEVVVGPELELAEIDDDLGEFEFRSDDDFDPN